MKNTKEKNKEKIYKVKILIEEWIDRDKRVKSNRKEKLRNIGNYNNNKYNYVRLSSLRAWQKYDDILNEIRIERLRNIIN